MDNSEKQRDSFVFYRSFYEAIKELPSNNQLDIYNAIATYSLNFEDPDLTGLSKTIFILIKPQIEANHKRFLNGMKPKTKQNRSKTEAKSKQEESKVEANVNVNVNVNENVNENVNDNENVFSEEIINFTKELVQFFDKQIVLKLTAKQKNDWIDTVNKLINIDKYTKEQIKTAVLFARNDNFWATNFMTITKLRKKNKEGVQYIEVFLLKSGYKKQTINSIEYEGVMYNYIGQAPIRLAIADFQKMFGTDETKYKNLFENWKYLKNLPKY